uniref:Uncharacterized protein n=1 Tax=viral metagenome TaxID=1070528 RepID=A0A6M3LDL2_9ZZZZ
MPTQVDTLRKESSPAKVRAAISACIATEIKNGRERDQAIAICYSMARKKTGKAIK